jgi:hypothetical protein
VYLLLALLLVAIGVVVAMIIVVTKGDDSTGVDAGTTPVGEAPAPTSPADPQAATKAAVLDAYRQSSEAFLAVGMDPNGKPEDPRLKEHATGPALLAAQRSIFGLRNNGKVYQGTVEFHPVVVELGPSTATVQDCSIDRTATVVLATGEVTSPPGSEGGLATAHLRLEDGVWKVYEFKDEKRPCEPGG